MLATHALLGLVLGEFQRRFKVKNCILNIESYHQLQYEEHILLVSANIGNFKNNIPSHSVYSYICHVFDWFLFLNVFPDWGNMLTEGYFENPVSQGIGPK